MNYLIFYDHINAKISKANKGIGIIKKLSNTLERNSLLAIYKSFILSHQTLPIDISKGNNLHESFERFGRLGLNSRSFFNLATCSNYSISNFVRIPVLKLVFAIFY